MARLSLCATTLTIVIQLVLRGSDIRVAAGSPAGISGLYRAIATMFIEYCAFIAMSSVLVTGFSVAGNRVVGTFLLILVESQVCAPYDHNLRVDSLMQ